MPGPEKERLETSEHNSHVRKSEKEQGRRKYGENNKVHFTTYNKQNPKKQKLVFPKIEENQLHPATPITEEKKRGRRCSTLTRSGNGAKHTPGRS